MSAPEDTGTRESLLRSLRDFHCHEAWQRFMGKYAPMIRSWCVRLGLKGADIDDLTGEVLEKLVRSIGDFEYDPEQSFRGWLRQIVHHTVANYWRRRSRRRGDWAQGGSAMDRVLQSLPDNGTCHGTDNLPEIDSVVGEIHGGLGRRQLAVEAVSCVRRRVEKRTWRAFELTVFNGMTGPKAADELGIPVSHVYIYKKRILDMLTKEIHRRQVDVEGQA